ncbi:helix-turn-helix transcriptional regulator [Candidatus Woesearchaeota archaeon]|nr:helix-turn-helix transcriptional regulator [Candidatus Woesearchaeota archaeon]
MIEERIIALLKENSYSASDISRKLKKDRRTVSKSLEKLNENGIVEYRNVGMAKLWSLSESPIRNLLKDKKMGSYIKDLLNSPIDGISVIDEDKKVIWMNEKLKSKIGNSKGKFCYEILAKNDKVCPNCTAFKTLEIKKSFKSKGTLRDRKGNKSNFEFITVPLKDNKIFIEVIRNI